jgi:hypothetical protein
MEYVLQPPNSPTSPSFPHVFSGNPGGIRTGPPIKTFGGDGFGSRISSLRPQFTKEVTKSLARQSRNQKNRNISRKDAKAAKKIPLSSPFGKGGKRGILPKWRPADAVQAWHENDLKHLKLKRKKFAQGAKILNYSSTKLRKLNPNPSCPSRASW